jgi:cyclophilin family peptidyl-prolyl cis-trans isomerase
MIVFIAGCRNKNAAAPEKKTEEKVMTKAPEKKAEEKVMTKAPEPVKKSPATVKLQTSMGDIVIQLDEEKAPITTANFLSYVKSGFYDGTIFHRVIPNFMIQGGGVTVDMAEKPTSAPIKNEASNGLKNNRGTIAMARTNNPDSATAQFFINLINNDYLNYSTGNAGYAVFGKVIQGQDVVDKIGAVKTTTKMGQQDVPVEVVTIISAKILP